MSQSCPSCGKPAAGRFCADCGVALDAECRDCGNRLPAGARFCNQCGRSAAAGEPAAASSPAGNLPWLITGVALVALAGVLLWPRMSGTDKPEVPTGSTSAMAQAPAAPFAGGGAAPGGGDPRSIDVTSMPPREAADRLFNRVMQAVSRGDTTESTRFMPMALMAYGRVPSLDADGHYHLAILQLVAGDGKAARAQADTILAADPAHLFGLFTAAQAEKAMGNTAAAKGFYQRFLAGYDAQIKRGLPEYKEHEQALPPMKAEAQKQVSGGR
ncbi:MAG: hypothetical protein JWM27_3704 [Gemmatimonadetes bacterium]|nr:hypothetical protein [Gemmatimonadota bacterium]